MAVDVVGRGRENLGVLGGKVQRVVVDGNEIDEK